MRLRLALFLLALLVSCRSKPQTQAAAAEPTPDATRATLAQQKLCAEQAKKAFDENEQEARQLEQDFQPISDYTSHFDPQKNVCYVRITSTTATKTGVMNSDVVYDAFERRMFANYLWTNYSGKKYWEVKPSQCEVHPQQQSTVNCQSSEEFDNLVEKWFGVAK
jgi:hypothetical protein